MDCIQCGERKGFRKRQPRRGWRAPAPPTREVRLAPRASGLGQCPAHPIIRAHVATRRPKTTAREGRWLQPPFFPSRCPPRPCPRVARPGVCPVRLANCAACSHTLNRASWHQDGARFNVWQRLWHSYRPNGDVPRAAWQAPLTSPSIAWPPRRPSVHMFSFVHDSVWYLFASGERLVDNALSLAQAMAYFCLAISRFFSARRRFVAGFTRRQNACAAHHPRRCRADGELEVRKEH